MKRYLIILLSVVSSTLFAQQAPKVIMQLQSADTLVHKSVVNQINNLKEEFPDATIELVCHGPGLDFLMNKKSHYVNKLMKLNLKDVSLVGCEFTMSTRNVKREDLIPTCSTVAHGIAEIIRKQQDNWLYVKMGF